MSNEPKSGEAKWGTATGKRVAFKWTVEIEISPADVAGGLDLGTDDLLYFALLRAFPHLADCGNGMHVKILKSPSPQSIAFARDNS